MLEALLSDGKYSEYLTEIQADVKRVRLILLPLASYPELSPTRHCAFLSLNLETHKTDALRAVRAKSNAPVKSHAPTVSAGVSSVVL